MRFRSTGSSIPIAVLLLATFAGLAAAQTPSPCSTPEARQFDFWLGEWALSWADSGRGTNTISKELDGCVIRENFRAAGPKALVGMSVSSFDARTKQWKQTWVDNQGGYLDFVGEFAGGTMTLWRDAIDPKGNPVRQRMVFLNIERDSFDWNWQRSRDSGATWETMWAIKYRRRA